MADGGGVGRGDRGGVDAVSSRGGGEGYRRGVGRGGRGNVAGGRGRLG